MAHTEKTEQVGCPCWTTGAYVWYPRCTFHVVRHPRNFSLEELERLWGMVNETMPHDHEHWLAIDVLRKQRDQIGD